eukprot:GILK01005471.1.p1 GENE.GILK01005471.1~~GILK01005471.1.p1  ORF type:complete len:825 (-),score=138.01 GILK01005471.1:325-2799(-)
MAFTHFDDYQKLLQGHFGSEQQTPVIYAVRVIRTDTAGAHKKKTLLVLNATLERPRWVFRIHKMKIEKDMKFEIEKSWKLEEVTRIDGGTEDGDLDFVLYFGDKPYKWTSLSVPSKLEFIWCILQCCREHLGFAPQTAGVDMVALRLTATTQNFERHHALLRSMTTFGLGDEIDDGPGEVRSFLSQKETEDVEQLLGQFSLTVGDTQELQTKLDEKIHSLEDTNIEALLSTENEVHKLLDGLNDVYEELQDMEDWLDQHNFELNRMRKEVEQLEWENHRLEIQAVNHRKLQEVLEAVLTQLHIEAGDIATLKNPIFTDSPSLQKVIRAGKALDAAAKLQLSTPLHEVAAVKDKLSELDKLRDNYSKQVARQLQDYFTSQIQAAMSKQVGTSGGGFELSGHTQIHEAFRDNKELLLILKTLQPQFFENVRKSYVSSMSRLIGREVKEWIPKWKSSLQKDSVDSKLTSLSSADSQALPASATLSRPWFSRGLNSVIGHLTRERQFTGNLWGLDKEDPQVTSMLRDIYDTLWNDLKAVLEWAGKGNCCNLLSMIVVAEKALASDVPTHATLLIETCSNALNLLNQYFDQFVGDQLAWVENLKIDIKRAGILPPVARFPLFALRLQQLLINERSEAADSAIVKLCGAVFSWLEKTASTREKYTHLCLMENYHHLSVHLKKLNMAAMEPFISQSSEGFLVHRDAYVNWIIAAQFPKLWEFFTKLDLLLQRVAAEDIQFQSSHSKAMFRKVTKSDLSSIEKGVAQMVKRMAKHFCKEEELLQPTWAYLQKYIVQKFQHFEEIVARCYIHERLPISSSEIAQAIQRQVAPM